MQRNNYILAVAGIISTIVGAVYAIPSILVGKSNVAIGATMVVVGGLVLFAIALGQEEYATRDIR